MTGETQSVPQSPRAHPQLGAPLESGRRAGKPGGCPHPALARGGVLPHQRRAVAGAGAAGELRECTEGAQQGEREYTHR